MSALKTLSLGFSDLAYWRAFDYIPSQNPDVSMRGVIPVGNWLSVTGRPKRKFEHPDVIFNDAKKEFRFRFKNDLDGGREQQVRVDGTGVIMIGGLKPHQLKDLTREIMLTTKGIPYLTPKDLVRLMDWMRLHFRIGDFYNSSATDVRERFWACSTPRPEAVYGGYIPLPHVSAAIGYKGPVSFIILASGAQTHKEGGFVTFPTIAAEDVRAAGKEGIADLCKARGVTPRAVEAGRLRRACTLPDGALIPPPAFRPRLSADHYAPI